MFLKVIAIRRHKVIIELQNDSHNSSTYLHNAFHVLVPEELHDLVGVLYDGFFPQPKDHVVWLLERVHREPKRARRYHIIHV